MAVDEMIMPDAGNAGHTALVGSCVDAKHLVIFDIRFEFIGVP